MQSLSVSFGCLDQKTDFLPLVRTQIQWYGIIGACAGKSDIECLDSLVVYQYVYFCVVTVFLNRKEQVSPFAGDSDQCVVSAEKFGFNAVAGVQTEWQQCGDCCASHDLLEFFHICFGVLFLRL